jgi:transcriptional regulator CtsR
MKYVVEERFTDDLGFTFEKAHGDGYGELHTALYFMRKDDNREVFDLIEKAQYDAACQQYRVGFNARLSEGGVCHTV